MDRSRITIRHMNILICLQKRMLWLVLLLLLFPRVESRAMQSVDIEFIPVITLDSKVDVYDIAWSSDGKYLATIDIASQINVWESQNWTLATALACGNDFPARTQSLAWAPNKNALAVGCSITMTDFTSIPGYDDLSVISINTDSQSVAWSTDGQRLALAQPDRTIAITDDQLQVITILGEPQPIPTPVPSESGNVLQTTTIIWSPSGQNLAVVTWSLEPRITIWDIQNQESFSPTGGMFDASWTTDTQVRLLKLGPGLGDSLQEWDITSETMIMESALPYRVIYGIHHTNNLIVQCDDVGNLNFYDLITLQLVVPDTLIPCYTVADLEWSPNGFLTIAGSGVEVWRVENLSLSQP
jgi:WD40 repeat protein